MHFISYQEQNEGGSIHNYEQLLRQDMLYA